MKKLKLTTGADTIAMLFHILGFVPSESVAIIGTEANRLSFTLRVDAAAAAHESYLPTLLNDARQQAPFVDGALIFVICDDDEERSNLALTLESLLNGLGIPPLEIFLLSATQWWTSEGIRHPRVEIGDSVINAEMVLEGSTVAQSATRTAPVFNGDEDTVRTQLEELAPNVDVTDPSDTDAPALVAARMLWQATLRERGTGELNAQMVAYLQNSIVRDWIINDTMRPTNDREEFLNQLMGDFSHQPDWKSVDAAEETLHTLLASTPGQYRGSLLTILGWIYIMKGRASTAIGYLEQALAEAPNERLAPLLHELLGRGYIPGVVKNKDFAYHG